jgi:hypothetical protein
MTPSGIKPATFRMVSTNPATAVFCNILLKFRDPTPSIVAHGGSVAPWILTCQVPCPSVDQRQEIARDSKCVDTEGNTASVVALLQFLNLDFKKNV